MKLKIFTKKEVSKVDSNCTCLVVILLDSTLKSGENYYLQVFFKGMHMH